MHSLRLLVGAALLFPSAVAAQDLAIGCGSPQKALDVIEVFSPRFIGADSAYVDYRQRNNLRPLTPGEPIEAMTDSSLCAHLRSQVHTLLQQNSWGYWSSSPWETTYVRLGPYYVVYVEKRLPAGMVGGGWRIYLFDVETNARIPTTFECDC